MSESASTDNLDWVHPQVLDDLRADGRVPTDSTTLVAPSFTTAFEHLSAGARHALIPKDCVHAIEDFGFEPARFALQRGSTRTYRTPSSENNFFLREYPTYYLVKGEQYNPDRGRLLEHALTDKLSYTVGAGVLASAAYWALTGESE